MKAFVRDNALGLAFVVAFLLTLLGQSRAGLSDFDNSLTQGSPAWAKAGGWRTAVFPRSLGLLMGLIFLLCWLAQAVAGWAAYNSEQLGQGEDPVSWVGYVASADFWNRSLQNWQSELLAVGSFAVFTVFLRQRGSPESKPVGAEHAATATSG
jgi:uncharacterized protein DUF6766